MWMFFFGLTCDALSPIWRLITCLVSVPFVTVGVQSLGLIIILTAPINYEKI